MAPPIPSTEIQLAYPLYACDFDPQDANRLVVGGGGGKSATGVANKISVLDVPHQDAIQIESEIDLNSNEDSVNTIAVGPRRKNSVLVYAGINSSPEDMEKGKNEHFRVFSADLPSKTKAKAAGPKMAELSRSALFSSTKDANTYQRVLRISQPVQGSNQVGAVATGDAKDAQIAVFDVPATGSAPKSRGRLDLEKEAVDLDILQVAEDEYQVIYCSSYDMYTMNIGNKSTEPYNVFTMPTDESTEQRPVFRSIRYMSPTFAIATANLPKAGGVILQGFRLPAKPGAEGKDGWARLAISASLPKTVTRATGMAVRNLSPPTSGHKQGDAQFVIAVSGQDSSITIYTLDHQVLGDITLIVNLHPVTTLKAVHPAPISGLSLSHFVPPKTPSARQHHLKLASIGSMAKTVTVHSLPLKKLVDKSSPSTRGPPRAPRYILALKGRDPLIRGLVTFMTVSVLLVAILAQGFMEIKGLSRPVLGAKYVTPSSWHATWKVHDPYKVLGNNPASLSTNGEHGVGGSGDGGWLADVLAENQQTSTTPLVILDRSLTAAGLEEGRGYQVETHDEGQDEHKGARSWDELPAALKEAWKEKLKAAGHWAGEEVTGAVFKGVLFGEIAGVVANAVRG
ncbi:hypothetical protein V8F06_008913 [Rhypophila decipiens]